MNKKQLKNQAPAPLKEQLSRKQKLIRFGGNLATAALVVIPVADYATSDVITAKVYTTVDHEVNIGNKAANTAAVDGIIALGIVAQCVALSTAFTKSKKLAGLKDGFEDYLVEREKTMSPPRRALSKVVNAPYSGIIKVGGAFEKVGEKIENSTDSQILKNAGAVLVDTGKVNAIGPPMVAMQETIDGKTPSLGRNMRLGGLFAGTWIGLAEGFKHLYGAMPNGVQDKLDVVGNAFMTLTSFDNPYGATALTAAAVGLATTGWRVAEYHRQKESGEIPELAEFPDELLPFPAAGSTSPLLDGSN